MLNSMAGDLKLHQQCRNDGNFAVLDATVVYADYAGVPVRRPKCWVTLRADVAVVHYNNSLAAPVHTIPIVSRPLLW